MVRTITRILSSRLGTLLLCGSLCFGDKWPYINNFSRISLEKREKILQRWFKHRFLTPIRLPFIYIKFLCLLLFFSQVKLLYFLNYFMIYAWIQHFYCLCECVCVCACACVCMHASKNILNLTRSTSRSPETELRPGWAGSRQIPREEKNT